MSNESKEMERSLAPTTTLQQDLTTASQRKVNLIWEYTQAVIAVSVVGSTMAAGLHSVFSKTSHGDIPNVIGIAFGMVVGAYFQRTNHTNIGGIGTKPADSQIYQGR